MKCVFNAKQNKHYPKSYLINGVREPNPESPERVELLLKGVEAAGMTQVTPPDYGSNGSDGMNTVMTVHPQRYLTFLEHAATRWSHIKGAADEVTPNIHPTNRDGEYPKSLVAQAGFHMADASCPISTDTWESALWSSWSALHAADLVLAGELACYALSRPPGHHAGPELAGGFCYLNNTAIAAERLREKFDRVAILDVDLHHGNGTQMAFYDRADVLTVSLHAHPERFYPFFWGYESETGEKAGQGYNFNFPLPRGTKDRIYLETLDRALTVIEQYQPQALVIALGLDAYEGDPIAGLAVSTEGFKNIGEMISARLKMPTVIVQEGGYLCPELGQNLASFIQGFESTEG
jgi:acetoin utilization deacetylase AcuC-like enzyme